MKASASAGTTFDIMAPAMQLGSQREDGNPHLELLIRNGPGVVRNGEAHEHLREGLPLRTVDGEQPACEGVARVAPQSEAPPSPPLPHHFAAASGGPSSDTVAVPCQNRLTPAENPILATALLHRCSQ